MNNQEQNSSNTKDNTGTSAVDFGDSHMQTTNDFELNKKSDHTKEDSPITLPNEDMQSDSEAVAGSDKAGTVEQKTYGDTELNKGLEAQAKDDES